MLVLVEYSDGAYGRMAIGASSAATGAAVDPYHVYHGPQFTCVWASYLAGHPEAAGVVYRLDGVRNVPIQLTDSGLGYLDRSMGSAVSVSLASAGDWYLHTAPILAADASLDRAHETLVLIRHGPSAPQVSSPTHPDQNQYYAFPLVNMTWLPGHGDVSSVARSYYLWDHDSMSIPTSAGSNTTALNQAFPLQPNGDYWFHVRTEDLAGELSETDHFAVHIGPPQPPVAAFSGAPLSGLADLSVTFTDLSAGAITTRTWDFGDGTAVLVNPNPVSPVTHTYSAPGTYNVSLTVTGPGGADTEAIPAYITVSLPPPPVALLLCPSGGIAPYTATFSDSSTGTITTRTWDFGDDTPVLANPDPVSPVTHTYTAPGTYTVTLTLTGPGGSDAETCLITVTRPPNRAPVIAVAAQQIFLNSMGDMAVLDASGSNDPDEDTLFFFWREAPGNPKLGLLPVTGESLRRMHLYFPTPGTYRFRVAATDGLLVSAVRELTVYVPGLRGKAGLWPSEYLVRLPDTLVKCYASSMDAEWDYNPVDVAVCDSYGRYHMECLVPGSYHLRFFSGEAASESFQWTVLASPETAAAGTYDYEVKRGFLDAFAGTVTNPGGSAVAGALLALIPSPAVDDYSSSTFGDGGFRITNAPYGSWPLQIWPPAMGLYRPETRDLSLGAGFSRFDVTLKPLSGTSRLRGQVLLQGTDSPVPLVDVFLGSQDQTQTDSQGYFSFPSLAIGDDVLVFSKDGYETARETRVHVGPTGSGDDTQRFFLSFSDRGPALYGSVTDATDGRPVPWCTAGLLEASASCLVRWTSGDRTGYYQITEVPHGSGRLRLSAPGYLPATLAVELTGNLERNVTLSRGPDWTDPGAIPSGGPVAAVQPAEITLTLPTERPVLDGSYSTGANLAYLWRECPNNPVPGLLPGDTESMPRVTLPGFSRPGIYRYDLRVVSAGQVSRNAAVVTVMVPGLAGNAHASPSAGAHPLPGVAVRAYASYTEALAFSANYLDSESAAGGTGDFTFDEVPVGQVWVAARTSEPGFNLYGPVRRQVNYSTGAGRLQLNLSRRVYTLRGKVEDSATMQPLENVRVLVAPGVLSETFRTSTDAHGDFWLFNVPEDNSLQVVFVRDNYLATLRELGFTADTTMPTVALDANPGAVTASLSGTVSCAYNGALYPVYRAEVIVSSGVARTFTDQNGAYELVGLPPGRHTGKVRREGYRAANLTAEGRIDLSPGVNTGYNRTLTFTAGGPVLRGVVVDPAAPFGSAGGYAVEVAPPAGFKRLLSDPETVLGPKEIITTDASGRFTLAGVPHGIRQLRLWRDGEVVLTRTINVTGNGQISLSAAGDILAVADGPYTVTEGGTYRLPAPGVLGNDVEPEGGALTATLASWPAHGTLTLHPDGSFTYTHDGNEATVDTFTYRASNGSRESEVATVTLTITPANDPPTITSNGGGDSATVSVLEGNVLVTGVSATDPDVPAQTLTYSLVGGVDEACFGVDPFSGLLTFQSVPDFDSPGDANGDNAYHVTVAVGDGAEGTDSQALTVHVTNRNEPPEFTSHEGADTVALSVPEGQTCVTEVAASDLDRPVQPLTYVLAGGADQGRFAVASGTGVLTFLTPPDFEDPQDANGDNVYWVTVRVDDGASGYDTQEFAVSVLNVKEHTVTFLPGAHGMLCNGLDQVEQIVEEGTCTSAVCVIPDYPYVLAGWTDGTTSLPLIVCPVMSDLVLAARYDEASPSHLPGSFQGIVSSAARGFWALSGTYDAIMVAERPLVLDLVHDPSGRLFGTATYTLAKQDPLVMPVRGSVKGASGSITMKGALKGADTAAAVSVALKLNLTVGKENRQLTGRLTGSVRTAGKADGVDQPVTLAIPGDMDGTWSLRFELEPSGRRVSGTATLRLSNAVEHGFVVRGRTGADNTAVLTLAGAPADPAAKALRMKAIITPLEGGWARIESFAGKAYGQALEW